MDIPVRYSFTKSERLSSKSSIEQLFSEGKSFFVFPLKAIYRYDEDAAERQIQVAISVPKRLFNKAFMRNALKRQMREAYRHHKPFIDSGTLHIMYILVDKKVATAASIRKAMKKLNQKLENECKNTAD